MRLIPFVLVVASGAGAFLASVSLRGQAAPSPGASLRAATPTTASGPADALAGKLKRTELQNRPSSIPGRNIVQVRTEIPVGVESGWHVHPGEEVGYILAGTVEMRVEGRPAVVLRAGDPFLIPPRVPHNARDLGPETGQMLSTYLVEAGQPLASFVNAPAGDVPKRPGRTR